MQSADREVVVRLDHLFAGFPLPDPVASPIMIALNRRSGGSPAEGPDLFDSSVDGEVLAEAMSLGDQEFRITRLLNDRKLDAEPEQLHLHSAAVAKDGRAVLLAGRSGLGKSSLTAALVRGGWEYLTDEMVGLSVPDGRVTPYPRPLTLRAGTWASFPELGPYPQVPPESAGNARIEVSPVDLGAVASGTPVEVVAIVAPRFIADEPVGVRAIATAAETMELLTSCCYDLERLRATGAQVLVDLAGRGTAWQLDYCDLDDAVHSFDELIASAQFRPALGVDHVPPQPYAQPAPPGSLRRAPDAHAWSFSDGSAVVFGPTILQLSRLDHPGFELWDELATPQDLDSLSAAVGAHAVGARESLSKWIDMMIQVGLVEVVS